jgi:hypothetical protein
MIKFRMVTTMMIMMIMLMYNVDDAAAGGATLGGVKGDVTSADPAADNGSSNAGSARSCLLPAATAAGTI